MDNFLGCEKAGMAPGLITAIYINHCSHCRAVLLTHNFWTEWFKLQVQYKIWVRTNVINLFSSVRIASHKLLIHEKYVECGPPIGFIWPKSWKRCWKSELVLPTCHKLLIFGVKITWRTPWEDDDIHTIHNTERHDILLFFTLLNSTLFNMIQLHENLMFVV